MVLLQREEAKRTRHLDSREQWRQILETIAWAESQQDPPRNSPRRCLEEQARKIAAMSAKAQAARAKPQIAEARAERTILQ